MNQVVSSGHSVKASVISLADPSSRSLWNAEDEAAIPHDSVLAWTRRPNLWTCADRVTRAWNIKTKPPQAPIHTWMMPEKCWSRVHIDHAVNFMGQTWLVLVDAFLKYPKVHATSSTSSKVTIQLLEEDFAHFCFIHTIVSENATPFTSEEFQEWCSEREITHLSGAPYHPAMNGAAERLIQSFKSSLRKSSLPPK